MVHMGIGSRRSTWLCLGRWCCIIALVLTHGKDWGQIGSHLREGVIDRCPLEPLLRAGSCHPRKPIGDVERRIRLRRIRSWDDLQSRTWVGVVYPESENPLLCAKLLRTCRIWFKTYHVPPGVSRRSKTRIRSKHCSAVRAAAAAAPSFPA
jgi:hypothetical protein